MTTASDPQTSSRPTPAASRSWTLGASLRVYALLLCFLPCALTALFIANYLSERLHDRSMEEMGRALDLKKRFMDTWLEYRRRDVARLALGEEVTDLDMPRARKRFEQFLAVMPEYKDVGFIGADGRVLLAFTAPEGLDLSDRNYFRAGREGRAFMSDVLVGRATRTRFMTFSSPAFSEGKFLGVVFAQVTLEMLDSIVSAQELPLGGFTLLMDSTGALVADSLARESHGHMPPPGTALPRGGGEFSYVPADGRAVYALSRELASEGWTIVAAVPKDAVGRAVRPMVGVVFGAGLVSFLAMLPLVFRLEHSIARVVGPLARHAGQLAQGDYDPPPALPPGGTPAELAVLAEAFETMRLRIVSDMRLLETMALTDSLTGLPNRRFLMEEGVRLLELSARAGKPCSCLMLDVDRFKAVNDLHGHAAGDSVLAALAGEITRGVRGADLAGRLGGEEFLVVCASTGQEEAMVLAGRILDRVRGATDGPLARHKVTVSIGVSTLSTFTRGKVELFDRLVLAADMCMYAAKAQGRDRAVGTDCDPGLSECAGAESLGE